MIKLILGLAMIVAGIVLGVWVGVWWALIGGIIKVVTHINPLVASDIAFGIVRIIFAGFLGYMSALALIIPGIAVLKSVK